MKLPEHFHTPVRSGMPLLFHGGALDLGLKPWVCGKRGAFSAIRRGCAISRGCFFRFPSWILKFPTWIFENLKGSLKSRGWKVRNSKGFWGNPPWKMKNHLWFLIFHEKKLKNQKGFSRNREWKVRNRTWMLLFHEWRMENHEGFLTNPSWARENPERFSANHDDETVPAEGGLLVFCRILRAGHPRLRELHRDAAGAGTTPRRLFLTPLPERFSGHPTSSSHEIQSRHQL